VTRPKVLMGCFEFWDSPFQVGGHQIAKAFAALGWDVAYLSSPISPFHLIEGLSPELRARIANYRSGGVVDIDGHVWAYVPGALLTPHAKPGLRSRQVNRHWARFSVPNLVRMLRRRGFGKVDLLYLDSPIQGFLLDAIPHRRSVLRIADRMAAFSHVTPSMQALERHIAASVDLVVYSAASLEPDVARLGARRSLHLPNGVDFDQFAAGDRSLPDDLAGIPHPIAIYVGATGEWFDFVLMEALPAALPEVSFVLIGPTEPAASRLAPRSNLHLFGKRPHDQIGRYLHNADVGLIPFDVAGHRDLVNGIHPLKLYEYLASGLPVVASDWDELRRLGSPALLCRTPEEHVAAIRAAIDRPSEPGPGIAFARAADWQGRVELLLAELR
jgi:glycosyltransferase involved in cell wall biosynthesis